MIKANVSDKKLIIGLLSSSFSDNPSVTFIISGKWHVAKRTIALMEYSFELCMRFGEVWLSNDRKGCALLLFPQNKRIDLFSIWLAIKMAFRAISLLRIVDVLKRENLVSKKRQKNDMAYLWFIGIDPRFQKKGIGSSLLSEVITYTCELGLPVNLETSVKRNLKWYKHFGFEVYDELNLGYRLFFLTKSL